MVERLGLTFELGSDPDQRVVEAFGVQNPDTRELALHAVYIVDADGTVFYRKVARRRPTSEELIDAVDAHRGVYPQDDRPEGVAAGRISVAYPQNNFQALIEMAKGQPLPGTVSESSILAVLGLLRERRGDDALIAFRAMARDSGEATRQDLYDAAAWLTRRVFLSDHESDAMRLGSDLARRLSRVAQLEADWRSATDPDREDELLQTLTRARAGLARTRAEINGNADAWNLRYAKSVLRSYREVARAATQL